MRSHSPSFRRKPPSSRRKPESRTCGHIHRQSGASRNPGRAVTYTVIPAQAGIYTCRPHCRLPPTTVPSPPTVIPAQAGIQAVKKPYRQPRQSFQLDGSPSRIPSAARNPGIPPPSHLPPLPDRHCAPRQPPPGDPAPSHLPPLPGILDVGDAGSRFGCQPRAPSAPPNPKSPKIPP